MPTKIQQFLDSLTSQEADEIWGWLDGDPDAEMKIIGYIFDHHPELHAKEEIKP